MQNRIAMIGGGNMAGALVAGLVAANYPGEFIDVMDRNPPKCERLHKDYGVNTHLEAGDWLKSADIVVLAVKPQGMRQTIESIRPFLNSKALKTLPVGWAATTWFVQCLTHPHWSKPVSSDCMCPRLWKRKKNLPSRCSVPWEK